jgi:hypothetical protein
VRVSSVPEEANSPTHSRPKGGKDYVGGTPFTVPEPTYFPVEPPDAKPPEPQTMNLWCLIHSLRSFADFYKEATRIINESRGVITKSYIGERDVRVYFFRKNFQIVRDIDRVRALVLSRYGEDITVATVTRLLGDTILRGKLSVEQAEQMELGKVVGLFADEPSNKLAPKPSKMAKKGDPKTEARDKWVYEKCCKGVPHDQIAAELKKLGPR